MPRSRAIEEIDQHGNVLKTYRSIADLLRDQNLHPGGGSYIKKCITENRPYKGQILRYKPYDLADDEVFKPSTYPEFEISNYGTARLRNGAYTKGCRVGDYFRVCLGKKGSPSLHREVAIAFIPNPENKPTVNHKIKVRDGGTNHVSNLEWATMREQAIHRDSKDLPL